MLRSLSTHAPAVVTLLSPSPTVSHRVQQCLTRWVGLQEEKNWETATSRGSGDALDRVFGKTLISSPIEWDSVALTTAPSSQCTTIVHLLSPKTNANLAGPVSLLAVQQVASIEESRLQLAQRLPQTASQMMLTLQYVLGRRISIHHLLGRHGLPLLLWSDTDSDERINVPPLESGQLKELVIPTFDDSMYENEHQTGPLAPITLFSKLVQSQLQRPVTGLYRLPDTEFCLRPLPSAQEDRQLPPPSLIFHVDNLECALENMQHDENTVAERIGYNGLQKGQIMVRNPCIQGLDLRLCESTKRSSMFAEAQESLLAGSLPELQSTHVLDMAKVAKELDPRTNRMDCWVEFRANINNPSGFLPKRSQKPRIAKAPDLPYE